MTKNSNPADRSFVADSLAVGMMVMLAMTIVQRGLGFVRGLWFCRELDDVVVGQWSMAYDFLIMVTPIMLLGMPGTLPRYVQRYRIRGQLSFLVRRILAATCVLAAAFYTVMLLVPDWFGWLIFLDANNTSLIHAIAAGVLAIIAFNFVYELVTSLRQVRVGSLMQFIQSVGFTVIAIAHLSFGGGITGLMYSFVAATLLAIVPGALALQSGWRGLPRTEETFDAPSMWRCVLPFALAIWSMNLLSNVFALSDRYMILHWLPAGGMDPQAAVGQYHSGRIFPVLLMSVATMISGVMLPYLSADWESGRREQVRLQIRRMMLGVSVVFTAGAAVTLLFAPWLFSQVLEDRYSDGLVLMPMAFVFSIWFALISVGENYLWVSERGKWIAIATAVGLGMNIVLNLALLPLWGLHGAVVATLIANGVVLLGLWAAMARFGYTLDRTTFYVTILPITLLAGPLAALVCVLASCIVNPQARAWSTEALDTASAKVRHQFAGT